MIVDVFVAILASDVIDPSLINALQMSLDANTPSPRLLFDPSGKPAFVFTVDFHRCPSVVCARFGFEYLHICFMEISPSDYIPINELNLLSNSWIRMFFILWSQYPFEFSSSFVHVAH